VTTSCRSANNIICKATSSFDNSDGREQTVYRLFKVLGAVIDIVQKQSSYVLVDHFKAERSYDFMDRFNAADATPSAMDNAAAAPTIDWKFADQFQGHIVDLQTTLIISSQKLGGQHGVAVMMEAGQILARFMIEVGDLLYGQTREAAMFESDDQKLAMFERALFAALDEMRVPHAPHDAMEFLGRIPYRLILAMYAVVYYDLNRS
jgi:hypothetical protein